jgi:hypothetical protein
MITAFLVAVVVVEMIAFPVSTTFARTRRHPGIQV